MTERDFSLAVSDLQNSNITKATLDRMRQIVDHGLSSRLVAQATLIGTQSGQDQIQTISRTMVTLEKIAETDHSLACILMADLWSPASDAMMHHICDGIDLHIWHCDSVELQNHLKTLASSERDPGKRRHFEQLMERRPYPN